MIASFPLVAYEVSICLQLGGPGEFRATLAKHVLLPSVSLALEKLEDSVGGDSSSCLQTWIDLKVTLKLLLNVWLPWALSAPPEGRNHTP